MNRCCGAVSVLVFAILLLGQSLPAPGAPEKGDIERRGLLFTKDLRIPSSDQGGRYSFFVGGVGAVSGVEADSKGNIYVLDSYDFRILKFDPAGNYLTSIGEKGQGPGEFQAPIRIIVDGQDHLYVQDIVRMALFVFSADGKFLRSINGPGIILRGCQILLDSHADIICGYEALPAMNERQIYSIAKFDSAFKPVRVLYERPGVLMGKITNGRFIEAPKFTPGVIWAVGPEDRLYLSYNDSYDIRVLSATGALIKNFRRDYMPEKVTAEEKRQIMEGYKRFGDAAKGIEIPTVKPPIRGFYFVKEQLYVLRKRVGRVWYFDVFDKDGEFIEAKSLDFIPMVYKNGFIYTIVVEGNIDTWDITDTAVVRYRVGDLRDGMEVSCTGDR
jgi:hypothetical protein